MNIARDNKPDLHFIAWVNGRASAASKRGQRDRVPYGSPKCRTTEQSIASASRRIAGRVGSGQTVRGSRSSPAPATGFPWCLDEDPLSPQSVIDMSRLIEAPAGQHGFLKAEGDRLRFENADGPVKFWGVNASPR